MAWSTRELADLAGTSLRSVRHYHDVGLLPEPERRSNGYKQYGVTHLMRLLRIKRLVDLGFSLAQIADLGHADEHPEEALRALDGELVAQIERLQVLRDELAEILERRVPTDLPTEFAVVRDRPLSDADRRITAVMGRLLGEEERAAYVELLSDDVRRQSDDDFDALPPDADDATRQELALRMTDEMVALAAARPDLVNFGRSRSTPMSPSRYRKTLDAALEDIYNPAQLDVLLRLRAELKRRPAPAAET